MEENLFKVSWILSKFNKEKISEFLLLVLIKTLMRSDESSFIIYPDMIKNEIKNEISLIKNNS